MADESINSGSEPGIDAVSGSPNAQIELISRNVRPRLAEILEQAANMTFTVDGMTRQSGWDFLRLLQEKSLEGNVRQAELLNAARILIEWARRGVNLETGGLDVTVDFRKADYSTVPDPETLESESTELVDRPIPVIPGLKLDEQLSKFFKKANFLPLRSAKGWLSLNNFLRCDVGCKYCYGSMFKEGQFGKPVQIFDEHDAVNFLLNHPYFQADTDDAQFFPSPIALNTSSTEAFLTEVKGSTFKTLELLNKAGVKNKVIIVTKYFLEEEDIARLDAFENININIMMSFTAMPKKIEPGASSESIVAKRKRTMELLSKCKRVKVMQCYRPLAVGWNDSDKQIEEGLRFGEKGKCIVIGGITLTEVSDTLMAQRIKLPLGPDPSKPDQGWGVSTFQKFLPKELVERILAARERLGIETPLVRRVSCGISLANGEPDYNAHRRESKEKNCFSCPEEQCARCETIEIPDEEKVERALLKMGWRGGFKISPKGVDMQCAWPLSPWNNCPIQDCSVYDRDFTTFDAFALRHLLRFPVTLNGR